MYLHYSSKIFTQTSPRQLNSEENLVYRGICTRNCQSGVKTVLNLSPVQTVPVWSPGRSRFSGPGTTGSYGEYNQNTVNCVHVGSHQPVVRPIGKAIGSKKTVKFISLSFDH